MKNSNRKLTVFMLLALISSITANFIFFPDYVINTYQAVSFNLDDHNPSADEITFLSSENMMHTATMSGHYPGTFSFDNDANGANPAGFNIHEGAGYVNVISEKVGHAKVVEMYDGVNDDHTELHNVFQLQTSGTIEFWILDDDVSETFSIRLLDSTATSVWGNGIGWIQIWEDTLRYLGDSDWQVTSKAIFDDTWYHLKIEFECTSGNYQGLAQGSWRFYIDGEVFGDYGFLNGINNVTQIYFAQRGANYNYKCYVDAIGYSFDPNYAIGDNLNPLPPGNPSPIPIILNSIGIGIIALLSITLFLFIRKNFSRTNPR